MRTLRVSITDSDYNTYGIKTDKLTFTEILALVNREQIKEKLERSIELAAQAGLSNMTLEKINEEINAVRHAKNHH